jgi:hypothetical protein
VAAGESAGARADALNTTAKRYRRRAENAEKRAENWEKGEAGEVLVAQLLDVLSPDGFFRLDDRRLPNSEANLDHVLVGPTGVFVIDTKNWSGSITITGRTLRRNGIRRDSEIERLRMHAIAVSTVLENDVSQFRVEVRPVACFVGSAAVAEGPALDGVHLVNGVDLVAFVKSHAPVLTGAQTTIALGALQAKLPERTAPHPAPPLIEAPSELVVFLNTWRKNGRHRLYVKSDVGEQLGYLDLSSGVVRSDANESQQLLGELLPHYVKGDTPGISASAMSGEARGVLRRFLDSLLGRTATPVNRRTIIAAYQWRGYGKNRLYLHRIDGSGVKTELGWIDIEHGRHRSAGLDSERLLEYCAQQYRAFSVAAR